MKNKFNSNKFKYDSNYKAEAAFTRIKFGHDKPILETELNEMQIIQEKNRTSIIRQIVPSGFSELIKKDFTGSNIVYNPIERGLNKLNYIAIAPCKAIVNGYEITVKGNFFTNDHDGYILVDLGEAPNNGVREDLVYLEVWFEHISPDSGLFEWGYQNGDNLNYSIIDPRVGEETSHRVAIKWDIKVAKNVNFNKFPEGFGFNNVIDYSPIKASAGDKLNDISSGLNLIFANANNEFFMDCEFYKDNNLWVAGRPDYNISSSSINGKYIFALPMFKIKRRNKLMYSIENFNGASSYNDILSNHAKPIDSYIKGDLNNNIRPDGLYYDYIMPQDLIDLRKTVFIQGFDRNYHLDKNLKKLFNGNLETKDNKQIRRVQFGISNSNYDNSNITFLSKFDKNIIPIIPGVHNPEYYFTGANINYERSVNGYGLIVNGLSTINYKIYMSDMTEGTIDFFLQPYWNGSDENVNQKILSIEDANNNPIFVFKKEGLNLVFDQYNNVISNNNVINTISASLSNNLIIAKNIYHIRLSWSSDSNINSSFIYINGKLVGQGSYSVSELLPNKMQIGSIENISSDGFIIEDLIIYKKAFEQNVLSDTNRYIKNEYWPNLPKDFINKDTLLLPSFNKIINNISDNPSIQKDTVTNTKIIGNTLNLEAPKNTIIDSNSTPKVYNLSNQEMVGYWSGLGTSKATFTLMEGSIEEGDKEPKDICHIDSDLSKLVDYKEFKYNDKLKTIITDSIIVNDKRKIKEDLYAIIINDVENNNLRILNINTNEEIYDGQFNTDNNAIDGITLKLSDKSLIDIEDNNMILLDIVPGELVEDSSFELFGNIPRIHFSRELKLEVENNTTILNEQDIIDNKYILSVENIDDPTIKIIEQDNEKEIYNGPFSENIDCIPGLNINLNVLYDNIDLHDAISITTKKGNIVLGKYEISQQVSSNYNYDVNLKDLIFSTIEVYDESLIEDGSYEIVVTNTINESFKIVNVNNNLTIYEGKVNTGIIAIPGIKFDINNLPSNAYVNDAIRINTFSTSGSQPGSFVIEDKIEFNDYYSEHLKGVLEENMIINDNNLIKDGMYDIIITDVNNPSFKVIDLNDNTLLYQGGLGKDFTFISGISFSLEQLPSSALVNDKVKLLTKEQHYTNMTYSVSDRIPFIHYNQKLNDIITPTFRLIDISLVEPESFKLTITNLDPVNLTINRLSDNKELYNGGLTSNILAIPGISFNLGNLPESVDINSTVIISTLKVENTLDVIVKYDLLIPSGNGGFDLPVEMLAAGKIKNNAIEEISFNKKGSKPRQVKYVKPRIVNGTSDRAYDFSSDRNDQECFARYLLYHVNGNNTVSYNISAYLYGYPVIGIMGVTNRKIKSCSLIEDPIDPSNNYFKVELTRAVMYGELIQFELALGGLTFDYDTHSKTLISNILKTEIIEFESTGDNNYLIPCNKSTNSGGGILKATFTFKDNIFDEFGQLKNTLNVRAAFVDNKMFSPDKLYDETGNVIHDPDMVLFSYDLLPDSIGSPFLNIKFNNKVPEAGKKIKIPVLISYQPSQDETISLWYNYTPYQGILSNKTKKVKRISDWKYFITTLSSGRIVLNIDSDKESLNNIVNRLPGGLSYAYTIDGQPIKLDYINNTLDKQDINSQLLFIDNVFSASKDNKLDDYFFLLDNEFEIYKNATGFQDGKLIINNKDFKLYFPDCSVPIHKYIGMASLVTDQNGEVLLLVIGCLNNKTASTNNELIPMYGDLFRLNGLPTIN